MDRESPLLESPTPHGSDEPPNLRQPAVFEDLVRRHRGGVERLARRLLAWPEEIDDVVQEVFARAWEKAPRYRGDASPDVWLRGIAVRVARSVNRNPFRTRRRPVPAEEPAAPDETRGDREGLRRALARLPHGLREVLVLRYLEECEPVAIAVALSLSRGAVDMRLSRARTALAELYPEGRDA